jgi:hypothetical protein
MSELTQAVEDAIWPGYGLDRKVAAERAIKVITETAAQALEDYGHRTRRHVSKVEWSDVADDYFENCDRDRGDRCDLVAAYNHAAKLVRMNQKGTS